MRVLLDECVNQKLRNHFPGHQCQSARFAGFGGLKNGELLAAAEAAGFDVLLTVDRGFQYEQNLRGRKIAVVIFCTKSVGLRDLLASRASLSGCGRKHSAGTSPQSRSLELRLSSGSEQERLALLARVREKRAGREVDQPRIPRHPQMRTLSAWNVQVTVVKIEKSMECLAS